MIPRAISPLSDSRASYHFLLGYQAELEQETDRAIKEYQLALQTDASSNYLKARLAILYFTTGDVLTAVRYADEVADAPGLDAQMLGQLGGMYAAAGKPDQALRLFNRAIEQEPQRSEQIFRNYTGHAKGASNDFTSLEVLKLGKPIVKEQFPLSNRTIPMFAD